MVICIIGPPSAGKTTFIKNADESFKKIISDKLFKEMKSWELVEQKIRKEILTTSKDVIVEIEPFGILDLVDFIVEIKPPLKPRRKLDQEEKEIFYYWNLPAYLQKKVRINGKNLKWEMLNSSFSKNYDAPFKWR